MKEILDRITSEALEALGDNLVSLVMYGSHARGEARPGSDINLFLAVRDAGPGALQSLQKKIPAWQKQKITPPVVFAQDQLVRSLDSFALEFAEIAAARQVLYGEDPFKDFTPDWEVVRREVEREARQKLIALIRRWLAAGNNSRTQARIIIDTVPGFLALLRFAEILNRRTISPLTLEEALSGLAAREPWFRPDVWQRLRGKAKGTLKVSSTDLPSLVSDYFEQASRLVRMLDEKCSPPGGQTDLSGSVIFPAISLESHTRTERSEFTSLQGGRAMTYSVELLSQNSDPNVTRQSMESSINRRAAEGWELHLVGQVIVREAPGCLGSIFGKKAEYVPNTVLIFRR